MHYGKCVHHTSKLFLGIAIAVLLTAGLAPASTGFADESPGTRLATGPAADSTSGGGGAT